MKWLRSHWHEHTLSFFNALKPEGLVSYAKVVQLYREEIKFLSNADRRWILHQTARKLWRLA